MRNPSPPNSSELTVGALREWLNDQHRTNLTDRDYSAAIVRDREALTRMMEHYAFCKRLEPETQNDQHQATASK